MVRSASLASLALLVAAPAAPARAADVPKEPGVYWQQSVEMQMAGFSMPAQTHKVCVPKKGMEEPPSGREDGKCKMTDVKRSGSRMTWKMTCEDGSTGEGDITSGPDAFDGTMTMRTQGNEVHMKMKGKKVGGDCDANEMKRKVAGMQKQADDSRAEVARSQANLCADAAQKMNLQLFVSPFAGLPPTCKDSSQLCAALETRQGLMALRANGGKDGAEKAGKLCKKDLDAVVSRLCAAAAKEQSKQTKLGDQASMEFVFGYCPDLARTLAKRECSGRKYTSLPDAQREFCTRWAEKGLRGGGEEPAAAPVSSGRYLKSGIPDPDAGDQPTKKAAKKKKPAAEEEDDAASQPKQPEDMKSKIMKGIFGR